MDLHEDWKEFCATLNRHEVEYLVVGGYAVGHHGYPRNTLDMDVWVAMAPENAARIVRALERFGFSSAADVARLLVREKQVVRMGVPPLRLEILTTVSGVKFSDCYARRAVTIVDGIEVSFIGLAELKANKKASGRRKDLDDLEHFP